MEYPYDLPRETSEVQIMIKNQDSLKSINENKNQVICKILSSTHEIRTRPKKNFIPEKIKEINEWIKYRKLIYFRLLQYKKKKFYVLGKTIFY